MSKFLPFACLVAAAAAFMAPAPASAADAMPLEGCVNLSPTHEGVRFGSKSLLVKDGDAHYRVDLGRSCSAMTLATSVTIETDGQANRLCAADSEVSTNRGSCDVRKVETIDAATFDRYKRRR